MKGKFIIALLMLSSGALFSQVGVNTTAPSATLDIIAKNPTGSSTAIDGVIIPRVDRQRAQNMVGIVTSTLIYVNDISTGSQTGNAQNIDSVGFYYYNGTVWVKFTQSSTGDTFVPEVVAAGTSMAPQIMADGSGYNKWTFNVNTNDGNWNAANNVYTIPTSGYYQFSLQGIVTASSSPNSFAWVVQYDTSRYTFNTRADVGANFPTNSGGVITLYLAQGAQISFGGVPCFGCGANYTVDNRTFSIMFMGS
nr:hypothetical protein [uncultured Chryseobacterium sp.]